MLYLKSSKGNNKKQTKRMMSMKFLDFLSILVYGGLAVGTGFGVFEMPSKSFVIFLMGLVALQSLASFIERVGDE